MILCDLFRLAFEQCRQDFAVLLGQVVFDRARFFVIILIADQIDAGCAAITFEVDHRFGWRPEQVVHVSLQVLDVATQHFGATQGR